MESVLRILLISNSTVYGCGYLDHVEQQIESFLGSARKVLFFPFALFDRDTYAAKAKARFALMGYLIETAHAVSDPHQAIEQTDAIFIGGGNTFRLLKALQDLDLLDPIRQRVKRGAPYIGSSAGSNVAGPTIKTTKDMPIVQPRSFDSLGLVPFQISPHFQDPDPNSKHMGRDTGRKDSSVSRGKRDTGSRDSRGRMAGLRRRRRDIERRSCRQNLQTR
jgi:dipeptidase E